MDILYWIIVGYLVLINVITFITFGVDKSRAKNRAWRTPEKRLFFLAVIGGSIGAILGMYTFRHKVRKWYFVIGMPAILIVELSIVFALGLLPIKPADVFSPSTASEAPVSTSAPITDEATENPDADKENETAHPITDDEIPDYSGSDEVVFYYNEPSFSNKEKEEITGETYSELDSLGRCGVAVARLHKSMMPEGERGYIGHIKPSGWHTVKYPDLIKDRYLYNRCHLIAFALTGQTSNEKNLITGTRHLNAELMLPYEMQVIKCLEETDNHVLYRVTPRFKGDELVARGVEMEAWSVEDEGEGVSFHVFLYNVQPGIEIDYKTGKSKREKD